MYIPFISDQVITMWSVHSFSITGFINCKIVFILEKVGKSFTMTKVCLNNRFAVPRSNYRTTKLS